MGTLIGSVMRDKSEGLRAVEFVEQYNQLHPSDGISPGFIFWLTSATCPFRALGERASFDIWCGRLNHYRTQILTQH